MFIPYYVLAIFFMALGVIALVIAIGLGFHISFLKELKIYIGRLEKTFNINPNAARVAMESRILKNHFTLMLACFLTEAQKVEGEKFNKLCVRDIIGAYVDFKTGTLTMLNNKGTDELTASLKDVFYDYVVNGKPYVDLPVIVVKLDCEGAKSIEVTNAEVLEEIMTYVKRFNKGHKAFFK